MGLKVNWDLDFITEENFKKHVEETILKYESNLQPFDLKRLNKNVLDPIKLIFDKHVYRMDWEEIIKNIKPTIMTLVIFSRRFLSI